MSLKNVAKETITLSVLMVGREPISTPDLIEKFPKGFTVKDFDIVDAIIDEKPAHYAVITIEEDDDIYYTCGIIITKMIDAYVEECGNLEQAVTNYAKEEKLKLKLAEGKNKSGKNNLTKVDIL